MTFSPPTLNCSPPAKISLSPATTAIGG
jgi:hypothetical protein